MDILPFKPDIPGIRTLWVLKFHPVAPLYKADFFIPSPERKNEWHYVNPENNRKAQKMLKQIQDACQEIKEQCKGARKLETKDEYMQRTLEVVKDLKSLDEMMRTFNDFLKHFGPNEGIA